MPTTGSATGRHGALAVVAICFGLVVIDGYDLIVFGSLVPSLLEEPGWHLTPASAGALASAALIGMLIGTLVSGLLTDRIGRRAVAVASVVWFSAAMALCAVAPSPELLWLFRFLGGLGLGGLGPTAVALTVEYAPRGRRQFFNAMMFAGYPAGGIAAGVLAILLLPQNSWRVMFWIGALPLVLVVPLLLRFLPESAVFLASKGRHTEAARLAGHYGIDLSAPVAAEPVADAAARGRPMRILFSRGYLTASVLFAAGNFFVLLLIFGLSTGLPQTMRQAGYPLSSALAFLLAFNVGGIFGALVLSRAADRVGSKPVTSVALTVAAACVTVLSLRLDVGVMLLVVALAGLCAAGNQALVNGYVATYYPTAARASAIGWATGIGRSGAIVGPLVGGWLLSSGLQVEWTFYAFAGAALAAAGLIAMVPRPPVGASRPRSISAADLVESDLSTATTTTQRRRPSRLKENQG